MSNHGPSTHLHVSNPFPKIAQVSLHQPPHSALSLDSLRAEITLVFSRLSLDPAINVVILELSGTGDAGFDPAAGRLERMRGEQMRLDASEKECLRAIERFVKRMF